MKGRLSILLVLGVLAVAWGCRGEKEKKSEPPKATAGDAAADELLAEIMEGGKPKADPPKVAKTGPPKDEPPKVAKAEPTKTEPAKVAKAEPTKPAATGTSAPELERLFAEMARKDGVDPKAAGRAEALFAAGKKLYDDVRYEAALRKFNQALRIYPRHRAAAQYAAKTRAILNVGLDPMRKALEQLERAERVRVQEALARVQSVVDAGNRARAEANRSHPGDGGKPDDQVLSRKRKSAEEAMASYDRALEIIRWLPYQVDLSALRRRVKAAKSETGAIIKGLDGQLAAYRRDQAEKARLGGRAREQLFFYRKIKAMLDRAAFDYKNGKFVECEAICDQVLRLDPKNGTAEGLRAKSRQKRHRSNEAQTYLDKEIERRGVMEHIEAATIPFSKVLVYPDNWQKVMLRNESLGMSSEAEPEWRTSIRRKLEKKVNFEFVQAPLSEAINFLQQVSDVNMIIDPAVKAGGEKPITLKMTQASLKLALDWILKLAGLDYELRDNAVFISTPNNLRPDTNMRIYDVQDLILAIPDFPGPDMDLQANQAGALQVFAAPPAQAQNDEAQIVAMIKTRIRPDTWGPNQGTSIQPRNGKLVVVQRPEVHRMISSLLSDLRSTQKVLVVVEGRLLTIREGLFEDIGVDWGTADVSGSSFAHQSVGGYYRRGWRRSDSVDPTTQIMGWVINNNVNRSADRTPIGEHYAGLADGLTGLSTEFNFLRGSSLLPKLQLKAILHALRIRENGAVLQAPKLVVHNGQRAHMWVGTQRSYVSGWSASGDDATPTTNQLLTGVVFDVRPIVSANRRYITLELRPTFTELLSLDSSSSTQSVDDDDDDDDDTTTTLTTTTELPDVQVTRVRTSVTIPDGGIILTGGRMRDVQFEAETGIPFLKDIPFLGRAFRWNRKDNERENLAILVTARTLLFEEEERKQF
jgi:general secretion pathway protein D